jgi:hypothetical protein
MTEREYIDAMNAGATLIRTDTGASSWCSVRSSDGSVRKLVGSFPLNETHPVALRPIMESPNGPRWYVAAALPKTGDEKD